MAGEKETPWKCTYKHVSPRNLLQILAGLDIRIQLPTPRGSRLRGTQMSHRKRAINTHKRIQTRPRRHTFTNTKGKQE